MKRLLAFLFASLFMLLSCRNEDSDNPTRLRAKEAMVTCIVGYGTSNAEMQSAEVYSVTWSDNVNNIMLCNTKSGSDKDINVCRSELTADVSFLGKCPVKTCYVSDDKASLYIIIQGTDNPQRPLAIIIQAPVKN